MLDEFEDQGFVVIQGAFSASACKPMRDAIWTSLQDRFGIQKDKPSTWTTEQPSGFGSLRKSGVFNEVGSPLVVAAVDTLLGENAWNKPKHWGGPLVTFPTPEKWSPPQTGWHIDYPARGNLTTPFAVKMLGLLADMKPTGGATLLARGSHHLVRRLVTDTPGGDAGVSSAVKSKLYASNKSFQNDIFEFVGTAGDVLLFDPWLFHSASKNSLTSPRLMIEQNLPSRQALSIYLPSEKNRPDDRGPHADPRCLNLRSAVIPNGSITPW